MISWRYMAPDPERTPLPLRQALATGKLTVLHDAVVSKILTDDKTGRAVGVAYINAKSRRLPSYMHR